MNRKQNIHQKLSTLIALTAFAASTAFAAGGAPTPKASTTALARQTASVCTPQDGPRGPRNGQPGRGGKDATGMRMRAPAAPTAAAPNGKTPPAPKNALARPAPGAQVSNTQAPGDCGVGGHRGGPDGQRAPATPTEAAARAQTELTRIDALLVRTTDAKARGYLTDARSLIVSGNMRAAHDLIRAAEALTGGQK